MPSGEQMFAEHLAWRSEAEAPASVAFMHSQGVHHPRRQVRRSSRGDAGFQDSILHAAYASKHGEVAFQNGVRLRDVATLIERASAYYTLMPGDLLFTGTPEGVAEVTAGDVMEAAISGIGSMAVAVR